MRIAAVIEIYNDEGLLTTTARSNYMSVFPHNLATTTAPFCFARCFAFGRVSLFFVQKCCKALLAPSLVYLQHGVRSRCQENGRKGGIDLLGSDRIIMFTSISRRSQSKQSSGCQLQGSMFLFFLPNP